MWDSLRFPGRFCLGAITGWCCERGCRKWVKRLELQHALKLGNLVLQFLPFKLKGRDCGTKHPDLQRETVDFGGKGGNLVLILSVG